MPRLILPAGLVLVVLAACATSVQPAQLSEERVCLHHHENNPAEQARCRLDPALRNDTPPDVSPHELPLEANSRTD